MSFLTAILFTFLIVWLLGQLLRRYFPQILMWLVGRRMRSQMNDYQARQQRAYERARQQERQSKGRRRGKIFGSNVGEYVEFEEMKVYTYSETANETVKSDFKPEPQVSDAEWEDIKNEK